VQKDQVSQQFLTRLAELEAWLDGQQIPHAIIGGLAVSAYVDGGAAADFDRSGAYQKWQRTPDVDLLVPRANLPAVHAYADASKADPFSVKVDTAPSQGYIDFRPNARRSYLTHRELHFPVPTELFTPRKVPLLGQEITTLDPRVLLHTFGTIGGVVRSKDVPKIVSLAETLASGTATSRFSEEQCSVFSRYQVARKRRYPLFIGSKHVWEGVQAVLPTKATGALQHHLSPLAQRVIGQMNRDRSHEQRPAPRVTPRRDRGR
jgi:hypothetical protein